MKKKTSTSPWDFLWYALYAFAGLGLELVLLSFVEPLLFSGISSGSYSTAQRILHWLLTVLCWGLMIGLLAHSSRHSLHFDLSEGGTPGRKRVALGAILALVCDLLNAMDWGTLKIIGEFQSKGALLFLFQYLYYVFEVGLVFLIVAFGQRFAEGLISRRSGRSQGSGLSLVPFGGLVLCCTWGAIHILSRGSLYTGLGVMIFSLLYGLIYLLCEKNAKYAFPLMLAAFIL